MENSLWPIDHLFKTPETYPAQIFAESGVTGLFFDGLPYHDKPTHIFAWYGSPSVPVDGLAPGIVLVHGGGGTAFAEWVRLWTARGYAAIAMDLDGMVPVGVYNEWERHDMGGPAGIAGPNQCVFDCIDEPVHDQWCYHAIAAIIRAHSLLRSMPGVDPNRIGITGISWGGFATCIAVGIDNRFRFGVPVYGCGFVDDMPNWQQALQKMSPEKSARWIAHWDPKHYLNNASIPMLWVTGTNDFAFPLPALQRSYRSCPGKRSLCVRIRMPHGHGGAGENPEEIRVFADAALNGGAPLARISAPLLENGVMSATYATQYPDVQAELIYTVSHAFPWLDREWTSAPATLDQAEQTVSAPLPKETTAAFLNLTDTRGCLVSSEHIET